MAEWSKEPDWESRSKVAGSIPSMPELQKINKAPSGKVMDICSDSNIALNITSQEY